MSMFDAITIPIIFFLVFVVVGITYWAESQFVTIFAPMNATMNSSFQGLYNQFVGVTDFGLSTLNLVVIGVIFVIAYMGLMYAAAVYAHPAYFVILLFLGAGIVVVWYAMDSGLTNIISIPTIGTFFDPVKMSWFYVLRNNMYLLIALIAGGMIFALYFKAGREA